MDIHYRFAAYWAICAIGFGYLAFLAFRRWVKQASRLRVAILLFSVAWMALCGHNMWTRLHTSGSSSFVANNVTTEVIRVLCTLTLWYLIYEFRKDRRITTAV